jgi:hypothetical protein
MATEACAEKKPELKELDGRKVACLLTAESL